jgi:hypothetical protein
MCTRKYWVNPVVLSAGKIFSCEEFSDRRVGMKIPPLTNIYIPLRHAASIKEQPPVRSPLTPTAFELFVQRMQKPVTNATFGESALTLLPTYLQPGKAASSAPLLQTVVPQTYTQQDKVPLSVPSLQTTASDEQLAPDTEDELAAGPVLTPEEQERLLAGTERAVSESQ